MCYDIEYGQKRLLNEARRIGASEDLIMDIEKRLRELQEFRKEGEKDYDPNRILFHVSGFLHPRLLVLYQEETLDFELMQWGLIPYWVKDLKMAAQIQNRTINARGETLFEKPSFRVPAKKQRCLIIVQSFFEHHHQKGKTYPYNVRKKNEDPIILAGIWDKWINKETGELVKSFSIITTKANALLGKIHNNPKLKEPRMPLVLSREEALKWLDPIKEAADEKFIKSMIKSYVQDDLKAFAVRRLRGKEAVGNVPEAVEEFIYEDLELEV